MNQDMQATPLLSLIQQELGEDLSAFAVERVLAAIRERRVVSPYEFAGSLVLHPHEVVPVPMDKWLPVANAPVELLGVTLVTGVRLARLGRYVGDLLLYTKEELCFKTDPQAVNDLLACLETHMLRLPTAAELNAAREQGFWVELRGREQGGARIARELARYTPTAQLPIRRYQPDFFNAMAPYLGDLLAMTEWSFRTEWEQFWVNKSGCACNFAKRDARAKAAEVIRWVYSAGLTFAS